LELDVFRAAAAAQKTFDIPPRSLTFVSDQRPVERNPADHAQPPQYVSKAWHRASRRPDFGEDTVQPLQCLIPLSRYDTIFADTLYRLD
jgi:hypothetical protein